MTKPIGQKLLFMAARKHGLPKVGATVEFEGDRFTDKGPATGKVADVRGTMVDIDFGDGKTETFSWRMLNGCLRLTDDGIWMVKSHVRGAPWSNPSQAQASAGNYRKPVVKWRGLIIAVENPVGSIRQGKTWQTKMLYDYGYIKRSEAVDGDEVDVYLGPHLSAPTVFIVHQRKAGDWDAYDEDKCMIGFDSEADARAAYLQHYSDPRFLGPITAMPADEFVRKVKATNDTPAMIKGLNVSKPVLFLKAVKTPEPGRVIDENGKPKVVEDLKEMITEHEQLTGELGEIAKEEGAELEKLKKKRGVLVSAGKA